MNLTRAQAQAFVEALTGWIDLSEQNGTPRSPHAFTHLEAVFGKGEVATAQDMCYTSDEHGRKVHKGMADKVERLAEYFDAVAKGMRTFRT